MIRNFWAFLFVAIFGFSALSGAAFAVMPPTATEITQNPDPGTISPYHVDEGSNFERGVQVADNDWFDNWFRRWYRHRHDACNPARVPNGTVEAAPGCAITCNSGYTLHRTSCVANACSPASVTNGTVAAAPGCAITCDSGYTLSGAACVAADICNPVSVTNGTVAAAPGCAITCNSGYTLSGTTCVAAAKTCNPASVTNGMVAAAPGCAITCNSGYTLSGTSCVAVANTCNPASVTNGTVAAAPGCAITCNSGYTLSGTTCVAAAKTCNPASVTNGTVAAAPGCAITCNSGYTLSGTSCTVTTGAGSTGTGTTGTGTTTINPAFYVATNGSDNNAGTLAAPFATLGKCQSAMEKSSSIKTCYIRAGTYHPASVGASCSQSSDALILTSNDSGQTWSYYPPDGYDTAIIDGGSTSAGTGLDGGICIDSTNVTINGLQLQHMQSNFIHVFGNNNTITNNIVHDSYYQPFVAAIKMEMVSQGTHVTHNVVYNVASNGISSHSCNGGYGGCAQGISNDVIEYNYVYNYCYNDYDCGAIEFQDYDSPRSTNILAAYNYVQDGDLTGPGAPVNDGGGIGGGRALYLDDGTSNVTYKGNIVTGKNQLCLQIHGGSNDVYEDNICDLQVPAANQNTGNTGEFIVYYQNSPEGNGMLNNHSDNNIIIASDPKGGLGYTADAAPTQLEVSKSAYHNYAGGPTGSCYSGGINDCGGAGTDSSPQSISTLFNACPTGGADSWSFTLNATSAALGSPVSFPQPANDRSIAWGFPGFWGPPGFNPPHVGNAPSYSPCSTTGTSTTGTGTTGTGTTGTGTCNPANVTNGTVAAAPGCAITCNSGYTLSGTSCVAAVKACNPTNVTNGTVAAAPGCAITCNSGYTLSGTSCIAAAGTGTRNPLQQPFASNSIWNMPIGSGAVFAPANLLANPSSTGDIWGNVIGSDDERIILNPTAPLTTIYYSSAGWSGTSRCAATSKSAVSGTNLPISVPIPATYVIPSDDGNDGAAMLEPDGRTITQMQPLTLCTAGGPGTAITAQFPTVDLYGPGITGAHGGSGLSSIGGSIRVGEMRPGQVGMNHALKFNLGNYELYHGSSVTASYMWPAVAADSDWSSYGITSTGAKGANYSNSAVKMGTLLAIPGTVNINSLGLQTEPGKQLAWTLQNYGGYVVDTTGDCCMDLSTEEGTGGSFSAQFQADYGYPFTEWVANNLAFEEDVQIIRTALKAVTNNGPNSIGGGGTPLQPLAPAITPPSGTACKANSC